MATEPEGHSDSQAPDPGLVERCRAIPTSTWSDALDQAGLPGVLNGIEPRAGEGRFAGPAVTVDERVGELGSAHPSEFGIDLVLPATRPGDVIVIRQAGRPPASAIGGLAGLAAQRRGVAGIVIDGACRDLEELVDAGLPIWSRGLTPASGRGRVRIEGVNVPLVVDGVAVAPGDMIVADTTGVIVLPRTRLRELLPLAEARAASDARQAAELAGPPQT
jgi:regulator of RNase E activity RraA